MKKMKLIYGLCVSSLAGLVLSSALTSCGGTQTSEVNVQDFGIYLSKSEDRTTITNGEDVHGNAGQYDTIQIKILAPDSEDATSKFEYYIEDEDIATVSTYGVINFVSEGETTLEITAKNGAGDKDDVVRTFNVIVGPSNIKTGVANYAALNYTEKLEILGKLEGYALKNHLLGLTLFESGGYVVYNDRIKLPQKDGHDIDYINGYGFGIFTEGNYEGKLKGVTYPNNPEWEEYYHTVTSSSVPNICYMDDQGSQSADLYGYISSGLYSTKMNATKDGYDYYPLLAKATPNNVSGMPIPLIQQEDGTLAVDPNPEKNGLYSSYRVYVKTGEDGVKFQTASKQEFAKKYNGRPVSIDDYLYAYQALLTQRNDFYRGAEMTSSTGQGTLKGALQFYNMTDKSSDPKNDKENFEKTVGLKKGQDENGYYLDFTFQSPLTQFYAMNNVSGSLVMPMCEEFVNEPRIGAENYAKFNKDQSLSPVDTILSLGAYTLTSFGKPENNQEIVFTKNNDWFEFQQQINGKTNPAYTPNRYNFPGVHIEVLSALQSDTEAGLRHFKENKIDGTGLTQRAIKDKEYLNERKVTIGDSTFKLNINSTTKDEWVKLFGTKGTIAQQSESAYWNVKPFMSNDSFLDGLYYSIDRKTYAEARGQNKSQDYFAPAYLWDPEGEESKAQGMSASYSETQTHKDVIKDYYPETYGYNREAAIRAFRRGINEMVAKGEINLPYTATLDIMWMNPNDTKEFGSDLEKMIEDIANDKAVSGGKFTLDVVNHDGTSDYQEVYNKMRKGQFDLGFGSISGMTNDPLGFLEVLKTDNSSGFTLNFGEDTSIPSQDLEYQGKIWSYDSLWTAATKGAIIDDKGIAYKDPISIVKGYIAKEQGDYLIYEIAMDIVNAAGAEIKVKEYEKTNSAIISFKYRVSADAAPENATKSIALDGTDGYSFSYDEKTKKIKVVIPKTFTHKANNTTYTIKQSDYTNVSLNINYTLTIEGQTSFNTYSVSI